MSVKCFVCNGAGRDYSWTDRDPIEGYKLAPIHICLFCDGKGNLPDEDQRMPGIRAYVEAMGNAERARVAEKERREAERYKLKHTALKKLTPEEREALGIND